MSGDTNALGGGLTYGVDPVLMKIVDSLVDYLNTHPQDHDLKQKITGMVLIPVAHIIGENELVYTQSSVLSFAASGNDVPFISFGRAIINAGNRWYALANGSRVNVLDAYVTEDIRFDEIPGLLEEPIEVTAEQLGIDYIPEDRSVLFGVLNSIRSKLYR